MKTKQKQQRELVIVEIPLFITFLFSRPKEVIKRKKKRQILHFFISSNRKKKHFFILFNLLG